MYLIDFSKELSVLNQLYKLMLTDLKPGPPFNQLVLNFTLSRPQLIYIPHIVSFSSQAHCRHLKAEKSLSLFSQMRIAPLDHKLKMLSSFLVNIMIVQPTVYLHLIHVLYVMRF